MTGKLTWGILGTGSIAGTFARGVAQSRTGELLACGSRRQATADDFGERFDVPRRYGSYEDLLADPDVGAVYISTPHPLHAEWAIKAAAAGKHVLCEKPLTVNHAEAMAVVEAAREHDVFLMEAFMYRCHPQTAKLVQLLRDGAVGDVRVVHVVFSFASAAGADHRLIAHELGGGGILDVGCYCASTARLVAGVAVGRDFAEPLTLAGAAHIDPDSRVDEYAVASAEFPGGVLAQLSCGVRVTQGSEVRIHGTEGTIVLENPFMPGKNQIERSEILVHRRGAEQAERIVVDCDQLLFSVEADAVAASVDRRQASPPAPTWDDTLGNMKALDRWREAVGMVYDRERPGSGWGPVHGGPLEVRADHNMRYGTIPGIDKPASRLVMGADNQTSQPHAAVMFDDFFERGGTCFDTAWVYGRGRCERQLGQWVADRGVREQVIILDKGAHTPFNDPEHLTSQLLESLERLQTDYIDLYLMHRDNEDIPVDEFVEVLNEHLRAGRFHAYGLSNWSLARIDEANAYARDRGLAGVTAVSNNLSLARMIEPPWAGCRAVAAGERTWFERTGTPLMPWSSQARGFFTGRAQPEDRSDPELVRCWYSDDNFARLERVRRMADERGVEPINVALAWVLHQPFPTFPLIGPRTLAETHSSLRALDLDLSPEEVRWLDTGE